MAHQVETMAYANEVPWHGLGNRVDACVSVDDMLVAAGLNWTVEPRQLFTVDGNGKQIALGKRKALVRDTDDKVLSVIGNNWKPLQNRNALEFFREYSEAGDITLETAGALKGGRVVWGLANMKTGFFVNNGKDAVKGYMLLISPHEPGQAIQIRFTMVRVVCANTLAAAMAGGSSHVFRLHHTTEFTVDKAREAVGLSKEALGQAEIDSQALMQLKMSEFDTVRFLAKFFTNVKTPTDADVKSMMDNDNKERPKALVQVLDSVKNGPGAIPGTGWGVINGITHWADHVAGKAGDYRLTKSWLGENARMKASAYKELLEMAA
ncbi:DUF932 domain-containing protein [Rhizobium phage RHph_I1_18]|nr:DUF932 domain-containing protein [Rhizobium phage RHph_I1_18]